MLFGTSGLLSDRGRERIRRQVSGPLQQLCGQHNDTAAKPSEEPSRKRTSQMWRANEDDTLNARIRFEMKCSLYERIGRQLRLQTRGIALEYSPPCGVTGRLHLHLTQQASQAVTDHHHILRSRIDLVSLSKAFAQAKRQ